MGICYLKAQLITMGVHYDQGVPVPGVDPQTEDHTLEAPPDVIMDGYFVQNGVATAYWNHKFTFDFYCGDKNLIGVVETFDPLGPTVTSYAYQTTHVLTPLQTGVEDDCSHYYNGQPGIAPASTRFAITGQEPQTLTLTGQGPVLSSNGMPKLHIYNATHSLVDTVTATSVSDDHTQATFPFPSSLPANAYSLALVNQRSTGPSTTATNELWIASSKTIAGNPFGVSVGAQTYSWESHQGCGDSGNDFDGSDYITFPVVSLYSQNQVLINGTPVSVGQNPTAVATYTSAPVVTRARDGCNRSMTSYSGTTRAVVANSGGNTVSILDIVNNALLNTVTVGSQPVALAVSPDSGTGVIMGLVTLQERRKSQVSKPRPGQTGHVPFPYSGIDSQCVAELRRSHVEEICNGNCGAVHLSGLHPLHGQSSVSVLPVHPVLSVRSRSWGQRSRGNS